MTTRRVKLFEKVGYWWMFRSAWWDSAPWRRMPADENLRCFMGTPVGYGCRRPTAPFELWCDVHRAPVPYGDGRPGRPCDECHATPGRHCCLWDAGV